MDLIFPGENVFSIVDLILDVAIAYLLLLLWSEVMHLVSSQAITKPKNLSIFSMKLQPIFFLPLCADFKILETHLAIYNNL